MTLTLWLLTVSVFIVMYVVALSIGMLTNMPPILRRRFMAFLFVAALFYIAYFAVSRLAP